MEGTTGCKVCVHVCNVGCQLGALPFVFYILPNVYRYWLTIICVFKMHRKEKIYRGDKHLLFHLFCFMFDRIIELAIDFFSCYFFHLFF